LAFFYGKFVFLVLTAACEKLFYRTSMKTRVNPPEPLKRVFGILSGIFGILQNGGLYMDKTYIFQIIQQIESFMVYYLYGYSHGKSIPQTSAKGNKANKPPGGYRRVVDPSYKLKIAVRKTAEESFL
jgi:hypothetical protein